MSIVKDNHWPSTCCHFTTISVYHLSVRLYNIFIVLLRSWTRKTYIYIYIHIYIYIYIYIYSHWAFVPILSTSLDIGTSGLDAAILDFSLPVRLYGIFDKPIG